MSALQPSRIAGTSYAVADEPKLVRIGQQQAFETVYLFDDGRMPKGILRQLVDYDRGSALESPVEIYRRRPAR